MAFTDQADFVISDTRIHGGLLAWKLGQSKDISEDMARVFTIRAFSHSVVAANRDAAPQSKHINFKPTDDVRSDFGKPAPVSEGPGQAG